MQAGQLALAYKVFRCWVSEFMAICPTSTPTPTPFCSSTIKLDKRVGGSAYPSVSRADGAEY